MRGCARMFMRRLFAHGWPSDKAPFLKEALVESILHGNRLSNAADRPRKLVGALQHERVVPASQQAEDKNRRESVAHAHRVDGVGKGGGLISQTPLGRLGKPEDIAKVVTFLASEEAGWITGDVLVASGGLR